MAQAITLDVLDAMGTIEVRITRYWAAKWRMQLSAWLIALAHWISPMHVVVIGPDDKTTDGVAP